MTGTLENKERNGTFKIVNSIIKITAWQKLRMSWNRKRKA